MLLEISIAVGYIQSQLYTKLPRRRIDNFGEELTKLLTKHYQNHWNPDDSKKDSLYRCLNTNQGDLSQVFIEAASSSSLQWSEIKQCLPKGLIIEIDPGNVTCHYSQNDGTSGGLTETSPKNSPPTINNPLWNNSSSGCSSASSETSSSMLQGQLVTETLYSGDSVEKKMLNQQESVDIIDSLKAEISLNDEGISFPLQTTPETSWPFPQQQSQQQQPQPQQQSLSMSGIMTGSMKNLFNRQQSQPASVFNSHQHSKSLNIQPTPLSTSRVLALAANQNHDLLLSKNDNSAKGLVTNANQAFTAAMFAQTKFGSTKLKNHSSKKNKRFVSPNDLQRAPQINCINENSQPYYSNNTNSSTQKQENTLSKQEMLREALQYQQQLLNNVELRNNQSSQFPLHLSSLPGKSQGGPPNSIGLLQDDRQPCGIWPTPIGAQRKQKMDNLIFNDNYQSFDTNHLSESLLENLYNDEMESLNKKASSMNQKSTYPMQLQAMNGPVGVNPWSAFSSPSASKWSSSNANVGLQQQYPSMAHSFLGSSIMQQDISCNNTGNSTYNGSSIRLNNENNLPSIDDVPPIQKLNLDSITS